MAKKPHDTPMLDQLETGPWPSFVTGIKRLAENNEMANDLLGQLETSYQNKVGYWKGGTVGVMGYGGGVIPRFTELMDEDGKPLFPAAAEFHTLRVMPPSGWHYNTDTLRKFADIWEEYGSGLIAFHGQSGDIMFQGATTENVQPAFEAINEMGFDLGGAGPALRTAAACVGQARCEHACYDTHTLHRQLINNFLDDMHRPALPYKWKFKFSGCANDCVNSIQRADFAVIGTWADDIQVDEAEVTKFIESKGRQYMIDNVITRCPSRSLSLTDDSQLEIDNKSCVRCMHCINVMTKSLSPGKERGISLIVGGKRTLKIGDLLGINLIPFMKLETQEDRDKLQDIAGRMIDFFAENALEHERCGEMIMRIGLTNFLEGVDLPVDMNMIEHPRTNPYVRMDGWDHEVKKWEERTFATSNNNSQ